MSAWIAAVALKPFLLFFLLIPGGVVVWLVRKYFPDSAIKRFLLISWKV